MSHRYNSITHLWLAGVLANIGSWLVTLLANRQLTITQMGDLGWFVQILTLASIGSVSLGVAANRHTLKKDSGPARAYRLYLHALRTGVVIALVYVLSSPIWLRLFQLNFTYQLVATSATLFPVMYLLSWYRGRLQAMQQFHLSAYSMLYEAIIKLVVPLLAIGSPYAFAVFIIAQPLSALSALIYLRIAARSLEVVSTTQTMASWKIVSQFARHLMLQRASLILLLSADLLLAKIYLSPEQAGAYAILSLIGKMLYFAGQSMYTILTPLLAPKVSDPKAYTQSLRRVMGMLVLMVCVLVMLFIELPQFSLVPLLTAARYATIAEYRTSYAVISGIFAISFVLSMHHNIKGRYYYSWVYLGALGMLTLTTVLRHQTIGDILSNLSLVAGLLILVELPRFVRTRQ